MTLTDPIEDLFYNTSEHVASFLYNLNIGITPNIITVFRFSLSMFAIYLIYTKKSLKVCKQT